MGGWKKKFKKNKEEKEEEEKEEVEKKKDDVPPVSVSELFQYSNSLDRLLMFVGLLASAASGACLPLMTYLFGDMTDALAANPIGMVANVLGVDATEEAVQDAMMHIKDYSIEVQKELNSTLSYLKDMTGDSLMAEVKKFGYGTLGLGGAQLILGYIFVCTLNISAERQAYRIRNMFLRGVLRQDISWYDTTQTGDFASRVAEDLNKLQDGIGEKMGMFVMFFVIFLGSLILAFIKGWKLTLVCLSCFPLLAAAGGAMAQIATSMTANELKAYGRAGSIAEEVLSSVRTIFAFDGQKKEVDRYENALVSINKSGKIKGLATASSAGLMWLVVFGSFALAFWYGTKLIIDSRPPNCMSEDCIEYTPGNMTVVFFSVMMGSMQIGMAFPYLEAFSVSRAAAGKVYQIINRESPIDSTSIEGKKPEKVVGTIKFENVYFNYPSRTDVKILQGLDLSINPGETVALVGSSGCGKSTTIQLIQRFYDPLEGEVYLDGANIKDLNVGWLRENIGVVGQEPVLFAMNIMENIRQGKPNASIEEVEKAAKAANAHDFIMKLPKTYETMVGERGAQLSGGQKQRIAIARALIRDPKILLLDEATSALDTRSEKVVQAALDKAREGRTTVVVAHRLSTVRTADRICAFREGKLAEAGTHEELMLKKGVYYNLVTNQVVKLQGAEEGESKDEEDDEAGPLPKLQSMISVMSQKSVTSIESAKMSVQAYSTVQQKKMEKKQLKKELKEVKVSRIMKLNKKEWPFIMIGCIGAVIMGVSIPVYAIIFGDILGNFSEADNDTAMDDAKKYACVFIGLGVGVGLAEFCKTMMFSISGDRLTLRVRRMTFEAMLKQEIGFFDDDSNNTGALCSRLSGDAANIQGATGSRLGTLIQSVTTILLGLGLSLYYDYRVGLAMVGFIPLIIIFTFLESRIMVNQSAANNEATEEASKVAIEAISNIRTVAGLHREDYFHAAYVEALSKPHKQAIKKTNIRGLVFGMAHSVGFFAYATCMLYGGHLVDQGKLAYDDLFKVSEALILGTTMVGQAAAFTPNYNKALASAARLFKLLDRTPAIDIDTPGNKLSECGGRAGLDDVVFNYPNRPRVKVLRKMNLDIEPGKTVALVGSSGCGKSTVIQLLQRFYDPLEGQVTLEGVGYTDLELRWLRAQFGIVSQEPVLLDLSLAENIAYGDNTREVPMQDIIEAAKKANIHSFIANLPQGYETPVGDRGTQLSGGQKQRVAIARALVRNPKILLLDEATSALDTESEKVVNAALDEARNGRTCITIAHRLSTIQDADEILVVHAGRVVERGTHTQLISQRGAYYRLYLANV